MSENEVKFVARDYDELETLLSPYGWFDIDQGYLTPECRVRRIIYPNGGRQHYFTFKQRLANGENLEIEPTILEAYFIEAWQHTKERLRKRRITVEHGNLKWDIDFYRWQHGRYFVVAEVEMPSQMRRPEEILPALVPRLVYEVPRDDGRFAARRLADEEHAKTVAQQLGLI